MFCSLRQYVLLIKALLNNEGEMAESIGGLQGVVPFGIGVKFFVNGVDVILVPRALVPLNILFLMQRYKALLRVLKKKKQFDIDKLDLAY